MDCSGICIWHASRVLKGEKRERKKVTHKKNIKKIWKQVGFTYERNKKTFTKLETWNHVELAYEKKVLAQRGKEESKDRMFIISRKKRIRIGSVRLYVMLFVASVEANN